MNNSYLIHESGSINLFVYFFYPAYGFTVINVDLDIDSDNNNGLSSPGRSDAEDLIEDVANDPDKPGKFICANNGDEDNDGVPDFADGFDKWGNAGTSAGGDFTPLVLEIAEPIELADATIKFTYSESNPDGVTRSGSGTDADPYLYGPAGGNLRIWNVDGNANRKKAEVDSGGNYVKSGSEYGSAFLGSGRTITLYVEGISKSAALADQQIKLEVDPDGSSGPLGYMCEDIVRCSVVNIDLDIDSDNDNQFGAPEKDDNEDQREDLDGVATRPGKYVEINHNDDDRDCVPDFVDGFDFDGTAGNVDDTTTQEDFTPLVLNIETPVDITKAQLKFTFSNSDPATSTRTGSQALYSWTPGTGALRLWKKDGNQARNKNSAKASSNPGDYIPDGTYDDLTKLGFSSSTREVTLYIETVNASAAVADQQIKVELDPDGSGPAGWVSLDAVRLTSVKTDIDIDSDNNDTIEDCDDPIEAEEPGAILPKDLEGDGAGQDYLKEMKLKVEPVLTSGKVTLSAGAGVKVWTDQNKTTEVILPKEYNPPSTMPASVYLDGIDKNSQPDIELKYEDANTVEIGSDTIKVLITETPSWSPAKADVAHVWSSLPHLYDIDGQEFENQIKDQGYVVNWYEDSTDWGDCNFVDCTLANYKTMPNCGMLTIISHGGRGVHYAVYAEDSPNGSAAIDAWIGSETHITKKRWAGSCYTAAVNSDWLSANWSSSLDANKAITVWSICYSATADPITGKSAVKEAAGGRWRIGYELPTCAGEARDINERFLCRLNGTTDSALKRTTGEAWKMDTVNVWRTFNTWRYDDNNDGITDRTIGSVMMDGDDWTTICPSPMADNEIFPATIAGDRYGWGCILFDTYMNDTISANDALIKNQGGNTYDHDWSPNTYGKFIIGFNFDKTDGVSTTMRAVGEKCTNSDPDGGRRLDGDRVKPNDTGASPDNKEWSY